MATAAVLRCQCRAVVMPRGRISSSSCITRHHQASHRSVSSRGDHWSATTTGDVARPTPAAAEAVRRVARSSHRLRVVSHHHRRRSERRWRHPPSSSCRPIATAAAVRARGEGEDDDDDVIDHDAVAMAASLEETYSRKTPLEHILLRPAMYIGPTDRMPATTSCWVLREDASSQSSSSSSSSTKTPSSSSSRWAMQREEMAIVPALLKVFDEILVNASDNHVRHPRTCNRIDVIIHRGGGGGGGGGGDDDDDDDDDDGKQQQQQQRPYISITNNGPSIPIQMHPKERMYIPTLLFGHLLTGSNFNDAAKSLTGGRHGYGAKLTNVFSKQFVVEICNTNNDSDGGGGRTTTKTTKKKKKKNDAIKFYKQKWTHNMHNCNEAQISTTTPPSSSKTNEEDEDYTRISFIPDIARLTNTNTNATILPEQEYKLMKRRVVDIAGCSGGKLNVTLNGERINISGFFDYIQLFRQSTTTTSLLSDELSSASSTSSRRRHPSPPPMMYCKLNTRWEVVVGLSDTKSNESISFVNRMHTSRGGTHVDTVTRQISQYISDHINDKLLPQLPSSSSDNNNGSSSSSAPSSSVVTPRLVRRYLLVCVNCQIENPAFDSQMKECLTTNPDNFGCEYILPNSFLRKLITPLKEVVNDNGNGGGGDYNFEYQSEHDNDDDDDDSINEIDNRDLKHDTKANKTNNEGGPGIVEEVLRYIMGTRQMNVNKLLKEVGASNKQTKKDVLAIPKLEDANLAGGKKSSIDCTLILTEGDSAKALAVAGLEVIGRDKYGVFPLRGKFLNVRSVSVQQLAKNAELKSICTILGLQFDKTYETFEERAELRYGHVMLMTDQDADGSHIKGLIMNLFRHFWPALLRPPTITDKKKHKSSNNNIIDDDRPFLSMFVTPLLKATKRGTKKETVSFFSMAEYNAWRETKKDNDIHKWKVKYYKGLGTSTSAEAKEYFLAFVQHHRPFRWQSEAKDGERIDMAFEKDRADDRKDWILTTYDENSMLSIDAKDGNSVTYEDFVDHELIHFSNANNIRSFPSVVDGLKPSQRKVLYSCFKRNLKDEIKVAQLAGYCAEHTSYHHGEVSLHSTIVGMAQDFVGSNNINLLIPSGQFGTRLMGGSDAASPRYIFTHLSPLARLLFPEVDDMLLNHKEEDGQLIEPDFYCPVIPLLLINGCQGIGTGWSTFIPQHSPRDVLNYIRAKLNGEIKLPLIRPWVRDFEGAITADTEHNSYITEGKITPTSNSSVSITELPVGVWTNDYRNSLVNMMTKAEILSFSENHTTTKVSFDVKMNLSKLQKYLHGDIHNKFKLRNALSTRNMHAFTTDMKIARYTTPEEIADAFFPIRLNLYDDRKFLLECNMEYSARMMRNKARFIEAVSTDEINLLRGRKSKDATIAQLDQMEFAKHSELNAIKTKHKAATVANVSDSNELTIVDEDNSSNDESTTDFDYLLNMPLSSLTMEKIDTLNEEAQKAEAKLSEIKNSSKEDLWNSDLDKLEPHF